MATLCETALQTIATNTANTVTKLNDVNTNLVNLKNVLLEIKDLITINNTKQEASNTKSTTTNELLTSLVISIKGAL